MHPKLDESICNSDSIFSMSRLPCRDRVEVVHANMPSSLGDVAFGCFHFRDSVSELEALFFDPPG